MKTRYMIDNDDSGHWYLIAEEDREAFSAYVYEAGPEPASMQRLAGHPSNVTFEMPYELGRPMVTA